MRVAAGKPPRAVCCCAPSTKAARSTSRSPTTARASIPNGCAPRRSTAGLITADQAARMTRARAAASWSSCRVFPPPSRSPTSPAAASAWTWSRPTSKRSAAPSTCRARAGKGTPAEDQDPADPGHHSRADRHQRRRALRHSAGQPAGAGAAARPRSRLADRD